MKKPVPRDGPAVIEATAGRTRLTMSSSDAVVGGGSSTVGGGVVSVGASTSAGAASAMGSETCAAAPDVAAVAETGALSRSRNNASIPPTTITSKLRNTIEFESCRGGGDGGSTDGGGALIGAAGVSAY